MWLCLSECWRAAKKRAGLVHRAAGIGNDVSEGHAKAELVGCSCYTRSIRLIYIVYMLNTYIKGKQSNQIWSGSQCDWQKVTDNYHSNYLVYTWYEVWLQRHMIKCYYTNMMYRSRKCVNVWYDVKPFNLFSLQRRRRLVPSRPYVVPKLLWSRRGRWWGPWLEITGKKWKKRRASSSNSFRAVSSPDSGAIRTLEVTRCECH